MTKPAPQKYQTTNWKDYNAAIKKRGAMLMWIDKNCFVMVHLAENLVVPKLILTKPSKFRLTIKSLYRLRLPQTEGMVESLMKLAKLEW